MKTPDVDRIRCEQSLSLAQFLASYNKDLPSQFPQASAPLLRDFRKENAVLFRRDNCWSLDQHRKKVMDWLPGRIKALSQS